jgi:tRNA-specific 2-thiouridylase
MRKVEVGKIGSQILNLNFIENKETNLDIMCNPLIARFTEERAPYVMMKEGVIIDQRQDKVITDHDGIHRYYHGQNDLKTKGGLPVEKSMTVLEINYGNGTIIAGEKNDLRVKIIILKEVQFQGLIDSTKPFGVSLKCKGKDTLLRGTLYFNNNSYCHIVLDEIQNDLFVRGDYIAFYNKPGVSGRLIGGGEVLKAGEIENGIFHHLPRYEDDDDKELENVVDIYQLKF